MEANLDLSIHGVTGGEARHHNNKGAVNAWIDSENKDNCITVDAFQGKGDTYKRREKSKIIVRVGDFSWQGDIQGLKDIIIKGINSDRRKKKK